MLSDWYRTIRIAMDLSEFHKLPRNVAYHYEYFEGHALLSPRPKLLTALLPLTPHAVPQFVGAMEGITFRPVCDTDWLPFLDLFHSAFVGVQPFASLDDLASRAAAMECLVRTRTGGDGPLIEPACLTAESNGRILGGILITLIPKRQPGDWWDSDWSEPPPIDAAAPGIGRPHLTWIFVAPVLAGQGIGTALLAHSVNALRALGFADLGSTLSLGNDSSTLWHWRNGFELMPYPMSKRRMSDNGVSRARSVSEGI